MNDIDNIQAQAQSVTATVCDRAALFGATPEQDEFDNRELWDPENALSAVTEAFRILAQGVAPDGTQLADERESLLWGFVNMLDAQTQRLDRAADRLLPEMRDLQREQDGSEFRSRELELVTDRTKNLTDRRDAFEQLRDTAAEAYRVETGDLWRPRRGSHTSQTGKLTSAMIDARDFQRARRDRENKALLPQGTLVAVAGGRQAGDAGTVIRHLEKLRAKYDDVVLVHGGGPGVERIAAKWADRNGVHQIVGVDLFQWTPSDCAEEVFRWRKLIHPTRRSTGARWSSWFARAVRPGSWPGSSSVPLRRFATGCVRPTGTKAVVRMV